MHRIVFSLFLFFAVSKNNFAQQSRLQDSVRRDTLWDLMLEQDQKQKFDSGIFYAKQFDSLTFILYDTSREYAQSLNNVGYFYNKNFDFPNAALYYNNAITVFKKYVGEDDSDYASYINNLAALHDDLGEYLLADSLYKKSLFIRKTVCGVNSKDYGQSLNNLGNLYVKTGNYQSAIPLLQQALSIRQKHHGKNSDYGQTLNTLALAIQKTGNYALAETKYKEALAIVDSCCGKVIEYWNISNNLASLYFDMGNYKAAESIHKKVLAHILDLFNKKIVDYATTLALLAKDYNAADDYDSSLIFLQEASEILLIELGNNHPDYATNLTVIAATYEKKEEMDSAQLYFEQALEIRKNNFGVTSPQYAETLNSLGNIYLQKNDFTTAEKNFAEAAQIRRNIFGDKHPAYAESITSLLDVYYESGNYSKWLQLADSSISIWKSSTTNLLLSFSEKEKQTYLDNHLSQRDAFLSMLWYFAQQQKTDSLNNAYFKLITALQGWLLSGSQQLNSLIAQKKDAALLNMYDKWLAIKTQYAQSIQLSIEQQSKQHLNADSLLQAANDLERSIIGKLPELQQSLNNSGMQSSKVSTSLKNDDVLVNWVSFKYKNPQQWTDSVLYGAFIVTPKDATPKFIVAFEQKELQRLLTHYFNYSGRGVIVRSLDTNRNVGTALYNLIWQPILPYVKNANRVFIISSGLLNKVSFQGLSDTSLKTLLETTEIHLLNNINEISNTASGRITNKTISVFGGADFDKTITGLTTNNTSSNTWRYLKGSAEEANEVAIQFKKNGWHVSLNTGISANEKKLKSLSGSSAPGILHIATHGYYISDDTSTAGSKNLLQSFPLLRSGFVLSGANLYWQKNISLISGGDGIVTAQEISNLNFTNTKLVVLSACETALGDINNNEGVYGLQRAFKIAGAKEMLITLWQIPDNETRQLMNLFYENVLKGCSYFNALREAQIKMKALNSNPAIWAGFELIGE